LVCTAFVLDLESCRCQECVARERHSLASAPSQVPGTSGGHLCGSGHPSPLKPNPRADCACTPRSMRMLRPGGSEYSKGAPNAKECTSRNLDLPRVSRRWGGWTASAHDALAWCRAHHPNPSRPVHHLGRHRRRQNVDLVWHCRSADDFGSACAL